MTDLSDTARVVLAAAAQRDDLSVLPFPEGCRAKGGAEQRVLDALKKRGLIRVIGTDGGSERMIITSEGMAAIGLEVGHDAPASAVPAPPADSDLQTEDAATKATAAGDTVMPAESNSETTAAKHGEAAPAEKRPRGSATKQALIIDMLKRPQGATVAEIAIATGWQHHSIRGAISGTLKKLGLVVEATREVGTKGSATVYRVTGREGRRHGYRAA